MNRLEDASDIRESMRGRVLILSGLKVFLKCVSDDFFPQRETFPQVLLIGKLPQDGRKVPRKKVDEASKSDELKF